MKVDTDNNIDAGRKPPDGLGKHLKCANAPKEFLADSTLFLNLLAATERSLLTEIDAQSSRQAQQQTYSRQQLFVSGRLVQELCRLHYEKRGARHLFATIYGSWVNRCTPVSAVLSSARSPREVANRINALENIAMRSFRSEISFAGDRTAKIRRVAVLPTANLPSHNIAYWGYIGSAFHSSGCRRVRLSCKGKTLSFGGELDALSVGDLIGATELDLHWDYVEDTKKDPIPNICVRRNKKLIHKLISLLHEAHFDQREVCLASCAKTLNMSSRTLQRRLQEAGLSLQSLRKTLQIYYATELIAATSLKLPEVAAMANYANAAHLVRHFRDATGMTPRKFEANVLRS